MSDADKPVANPHRHSDAAAFLSAMFANPATAAEPVGILAARAVTAADLLHKALDRTPSLPGERD